MDEYVIESEKRTRFFQSIGFRIADGISKAVSTLTADEIAFKKEQGVFHCHILI